MTIVNPIDILNEVTRKPTDRFTWEEWKEILRTEGFLDNCG